MEWFYQKWGLDKNKKAQINEVEKKVQDIFKDYKGKSFGLQPQDLLIYPIKKEKDYTFAYNHKRIKCIY